MIKWLLIFLFLYLVYGVYLAFDWITYKTAHFTVFNLLVTLVFAIGIMLLGPGWIFVKVIRNEKGE